MSGSKQEDVQYLLAQGRVKQAEMVIQSALASEPENATFHAFFALCQLQQNRLDLALSAVSRAIGLDPNLAYSHYVLALIQLEKGQWNAALPAIQQAIHSDNNAPDFLATEALIYLRLGQWELAQRSAEKGLLLHAEHVNCLNFRAEALRQQGAHQAALTSLEQALTSNPKNPWSHINLGQHYLQMADYSKARDHFSQALQLSPGIPAARSGLLTIIKTKSPIYRPILRFFLLLGRLQGNRGLYLILGFFFLRALLGYVAEHVPALSPFLEPIFILYLVFIWSTWLVDPLHNSFLRLHPWAHLLLNQREKRASNALMITVGLSVFSFVIGKFQGNPLGTTGAMLGAFLTIPITHAAGLPAVKGRTFLWGYTAVLVAMAGMTLFQARHETADAGTWFLLTMGGCVLFSWLASIVTFTRR